MAPVPPPWPSPCTLLLASLLLVQVAPEEWGDPEGSRSVEGGARLVLLNERQHPLARCLDGSMGGYYLRSGRNDKYLIYFEGGGWCYDSACDPPTRNGTLVDCHARAGGRYGSSRHWPFQRHFSSGLLSSHAAANPAFHDWTLVYLPYCDGTSWSGNAHVDGLHFRGKAILDAVLAELRATTHMQQAFAKVVVSGGSAGASAVLYHVDSMVQLLATKGEVMALPDAGFFLDAPDKDGVNCWPSQMRSVFDVADGYASLHQGCLRRFPGERWRCLFPQYYADLITTPTMLLQSLYDSSELWYTLRLDCCPAAGGCGDPNWPTCAGHERQLFDEQRTAHLAAWRPLVERPGNGVWAVACIAHTLTSVRWTDPDWAVPSHSGNTLATAVDAWLADDSPLTGNFSFEDPVPWPENEPCAWAATIV